MSTLRFWCTQAQCCNVPKFMFRTSSRPKSCARASFYARVDAQSPVHAAVALLCTNIYDSYLISANNMCTGVILTLCRRSEFGARSSSDAMYQSLRFVPHLGQKHVLERDFTPVSTLRVTHLHPCCNVSKFTFVPHLGEKHVHGRYFTPVSTLRVWCM